MKVLLLINPVLIAIAAAVGWVCCAAARLNPHPEQLLVASLVGLIAAEAAVGIMVLQQPVTVVAATQAALLSLGLHLMLCMVLAIAAIVMFHGNQPIIWWMLTMFWTTLLGVCGCLLRTVRMIKPADPATEPPAPAMEPRQMIGQ